MRSSHRPPSRPQNHNSTQGVIPEAASPIHLPSLLLYPLKATVNKPMQKIKAMLEYVGTGSDLKSLQLTIFYAEADQVTSNRFLKAFKIVRSASWVTLMETGRKHGTALTTHRSQSICWQTNRDQMGGWGRGDNAQCESCKSNQISFKCGLDKCVV